MRLSRLYDEPALRAALEEAERSDRERINRLTRQQRAVLALVVDGMLSKQAAAALGLSQRTIENYRLEIMSRTECRTVPQLVRLYMRTSGHMEIE
jgi:FixJ family two-component response regulator